MGIEIHEFFCILSIGNLWFCNPIKSISKSAISDDEKQSSTSKQTQDTCETVSAKQAYVTDSDIDAAKIAAMKAAESGKHLLILSLCLLWFARLTYSTRNVQHLSLF